MDIQKSTYIVPYWMEYNSIEERPKTNDRTLWWDKQTAKTTDSWWNNFTTKKSSRSTISALVKRFAREGLPLSPQLALELVEDVGKLNKTITEQTEKIFGEDTPELHELVTMWFFMLVNRTRVQAAKNTPFVTQRYTPTTLPTTTTTEPTWHLSEPEWMVPNGEAGHPEPTVTNAVMSYTGQKDLDMGLGTGQPGTEHGDLDTGQVDLGSGQTGLGTVHADLGTGPANLGTGLDYIGTGHWNLGTEPAFMGTGQMDLGTGQVDLDTGPAHDGTGQADLNIGPGHPGHDGTGQADLNIGPGHDGTGQTDLNNGPGHDGTGQTDLNNGPGHDGTGQTDLNIGPAHDGTGQTDLNNGPGHDGTGQTDLNNGPGHDGTGQADLNIGPAHDGTGQTDLNNGPGHDGTGQTDLNNGPDHDGTGQADLNNGPGHDGTGQTDLNNGPGHDGTGQADLNIGPAHDGTGQTDLNNGPGHDGTGQADLNIGPAHDGSGQADLNIGPAHDGSGQADLNIRPAHDGSGQADLYIRPAHDGSGQADLYIRPAHDGSGQADLNTGKDYVGKGQADTGPSHKDPLPGGEWKDPGQDVVMEPNHETQRGPAYQSITMAIESTGTPDTDVDDTTTGPEPQTRNPYYTFIEKNKVPDLRYIDSQGRALRKPSWLPRPSDGYEVNNGGLRQLMFTPSPLTPGSQGHPGPQGNPSFPPGPTTRPLNLPFVITQKPKGESSSIVTTVATMPAPTEVSTRGTAGRYPDYNDLLVRPDYDSMAGYIGRPEMVNEATNVMVLLGAVSSTTTTENPLVVELKSEMSNTSTGFFYATLRKLLEFLATMDREHAGYLLAAVDIIFNEMDRTGSLRYLGLPLQPAMLRVSSVLAAAPPEVAQSRMTLAYTMLSDRSLIPGEFNEALTIMDSMYHASEGVGLFASLVDLQGYPENNLTSTQVMKKIITAVLAPFERMKGTQRLNTILFKLNTMLEQKFPFRRIPERAQRAGLTMHLRTRTRSHWTVKKYTESTKLKGLTTKTANKYRHTTRKERGRSTNQIDVIDLYKNKLKRLKAQGMAIETAKYYTLDKNKHKTHTKNNVKRIIKDHLKNKHPELYENIEHKYIKDKEKNKKANEALFGGVFKNRFSPNFRSIPIDKSIDRKKETSKWELSDARNGPQTRFNIIDTLPVFDNENGIHKNILNSDKNKQKTDKSNYLSKYKLKTKQHKQIVEKKPAKIMGDSLTSDEEQELKFNLQDTIRHGDRKFAERRNYKIRNKNVIHELSSYSDEEGILKNNIYKVFGYTKRFN